MQMHPITIDHGILLGLTDDDHTQHLLADGTRALTANWNAGAFLITANSFNSTSASIFGDVVDNGLAATAGVVFSDAGMQLTSTPITTGDGVFWNRTGTVLSPVTAGDDVTTTGDVSADQVIVSNATNSIQLPDNGAITSPLSQNAIRFATVSPAVNIMRILNFSGGWTDNAASTFFQMGKDKAFFTASGGGNLQRFGIVSEGTILSNSGFTNLEIPTERLAVKGNIHLYTDGDKILFSTTKQHSIYGDGTDFNFNAGEVGTGGFQWRTGPDTDIVNTYNGTTNTGVWSWMEDEDYFKFDDDILLDSGIIHLNETTTPTPIASHGTLWTNAANELRFFSGDGMNHLVHGSAFSNIWFHGLTSSSVNIINQNEFAKVEIFDVVGNEDDETNAVGSTANNEIVVGTNGAGSYEVGFNASLTAAGATRTFVLAAGIEFAAALDVTAATNASPIVVTVVGHPFNKGDMVTLAGATTNTAANGDWFVTTPTADTFELYDMAGAASTGNGVYDASSGDITHCYSGNVMMHRSVNQTSVGFGGPTGDVSLLVGDKISVYALNLDASTDLNVFQVSLHINREDD